MSHIPGRIDQLEQELAVTERVYEIALRRISGDDEEWNRHKAATIDRMCRLIGQFRIEDQPSKAVAIVAQMMPMAAELTAQQKIVDDYREKQRKLSYLRDENERREAVTEKARQAYEESVAKWQRTA